MKRWVIYSVGSALFCLVLISLYIYWALDPSRHFEHTEVPILVTPKEFIQSSDSVSLNDLPVEKKQVDQEKRNTTAFNVLVLGIDARGDENSRTDVIMVIHVIPSEKKVNIISLPRDTRVNISGVGYTKINHAHLLGEQKGGNRGGTEEALQIVSDFLSIPINYYVKSDFIGFEDMINTLGGVDIEVEKDIHLRMNNKQLLAGRNHIDGVTALALVRERWAFPEGDFGRQYEQSKILKSMINQLLTPGNLAETAALLPKLRKNMVDTNFEDSDVLSLARMFQGMTEDNFEYTQIPGRGGYDYDPLVLTNLYYWIPDMDKVKSIRERLLE